MLLKPLTFHAPRTLAEASQLHAAYPEARILAGGTFLLNNLKLLKRKGTKTPAHVISLRKVADLKGITVQADKLLIRAMTIINDLQDSPLLTGNTAILRKVCQNISSNLIRNMATVGGNLTCRYTWTEMGAVMVGLAADMHFVASDGREEVISAEDFFKSAAKTDKLFSHVSIPIDKTASVSYQRVKKSMNVDIPLLAIFIKTNIVKNTFSNTRVAVNNGAAFAQRDLKLEQFLNGKPVTADLGQKAVEHLDPEIYDKRSDEYKQHMFRVSIKNAVEEICKSLS